MLPDILVYQDGTASLGSMIAALKSSFDRAAIRQISIGDVRNGILEEHGNTLLVIPGILGEDCRYHDDFGLAELDVYHSFLQQGGVSLNTCAGASAFSKTCIYDTPWGTSRLRQSLRPVFNGTATGPFPSHAIKPQSAAIEATLPAIANTTTIPVRFLNETGTLIKTEIAYGNGPALHPETENDPAHEILAHYDFDNKAIPAIVRIEIGAGAAYFSGIHPEIGHIRIADGPGLEAVRALNTALLPHEPGRRMLWTMLTSRIKADLSL